MIEPPEAPVKRKRPGPLGKTYPADQAPITAEVEVRSWRGGGAHTARSRRRGSAGSQRSGAHGSRRKHQPFLLESFRASVPTTAARNADPPICGGHIDRRPLRGRDACVSLSNTFAI